jgi:DNA-binding beta-propeller fold protein YncE
VGNGEISYLNFADLSIKNNMYAAYNNSAVLGDIVQSISIFGNKAYVVVNNSNKIVVLDMSDFKKTATISPFTSPRYIQKVANNKAYVTDLFSNKISIVNLATNTISGFIDIGTWTEQIIATNNYAFVSAPMTDKVYVIDITTDALVDSITVGKGANSMCTDKLNNIWVFCSGDGAINASVYQINPDSKTVIKSMDAGSSTYSSGRICTNNAKDSLYFIKEDVYRFSLLDVSISTTPFINVNSFSLYGLKVKDNYVMITDAKDFVQKGELKIYNKSGNFIKSLETGVAPGEITLY